MRVLILSCATGEGHNAAGRAVREMVEKQGHEAVMLDMFLLKSRSVARLVGGAYVKIAGKTPRLFQLLYKAGMCISSARFKSPVYLANTRMGKYLKQYLENNRFDVIVTPHLFPAETLTYLKRKNVELPKTVGIFTDYTCIPFWEETECDYYVIPHPDVAEECVKRGMPREKLLPLGIPVRLQFYRKRDQKKARERIRLPQEVPMYLVMSGSMGFGKLQVFSYELSASCKNGEEIVIICGNNEKLRRVLKREFRGNQRIHVVGFTEHVADYMDACDVVYTKPGGLTTTEAAVKNIPIVHTAPIPGCETINREFFASRGMSVYGDKIRTQVKEGKTLLEEKEVREGMLHAQKRRLPQGAAYRIFQLLLLLAEGEEPDAAMRGEG